MEFIRNMAATLTRFSSLKGPSEEFIFSHWIERSRTHNPDKGLNPYPRTKP